MKFSPAETIWRRNKRTAEGGAEEKAIGKNVGRICSALAVTLFSKGPGENGPFSEETSCAATFLDSPHISGSRFVRKLLFFAKSLVPNFDLSYIHRQGGKSSGDKLLCAR